MELKIQIGYDQVLEIIRQLPVNQVEKLIFDTKLFLDQEKPQKNTTSFQKFLLSGPTMSNTQYDTFLENRKYFNQWRAK